MKNQSPKLRKGENTELAKSPLSQDQKNLFRIISDYSYDLIIVTDAKGIINYASRSAKRILGWEIEDLIGTHAFDYWSREDKQKTIRILRENLLNPKHAPILYSGKIRGKNKMVDVESRTNFIIDNGKITGIISIIHDITAKLKSEKLTQKYETELEKKIAELELINTRHHSIINNSSDIIAIVNSRAKILFISPAVRRILGYKTDELVGKNGLELWSGEDQIRAKEAFFRAMSNPMGLRKMFWFEGRMKMKSGEDRFVDLRANYLFENKKITGGIIVIRDIQEQKLALANEEKYRNELEKKIEEIEKVTARYTSIVNNSSDMIVIIDKAGIIRFMNPATKKIIGYRPEEWIGKNGFPLWYPKDRKKAREIIKTAIHNPGILRKLFLFEGKIIHKSGALIDVEVRSSYLFEDRRIHGWILNINDVTARKQAEKEREEYHINLEREVTNRTRELQETQSQLIQQEKLASLGALTAGIAHEIKNPLNFVNNFSELSEDLLDELLTADENDKREIIETLRGNLRKIKEHGNRADVIVRSMLQHSRSGTSEKQNIDVNKLCDEFLNLAYHGMRATYSDFNCNINKRLDPHIPSVLAVQQDIGRVMLNLISNAFQALYSLQKSEDTFNPELGVSTFTKNKNVVIEITDNGPGISEELQHKIFEPFFTTKPSGQGTGLGLSISHDIIEAHGGKLKVHSQPYVLTTFEITLPL